MELTTAADEPDTLDPTPGFPAGAVEHPATKAAAHSTNINFLLTNILTKFQYILTKSDFKTYCEMGRPQTTHSSLETVPFET
jgi:hypothetical protein